MKLILKQCSNCQEIVYPHKYICPKCYHRDLHNTEVTGEGNIYSYTTIRVAPSRFAKDAPYYVILVELNNKMKITGRLLNNKKVQIGQSVELVDYKNDCYYFSAVD